MRAGKGRLAGAGADEVIDLLAPHHRPLPKVRLAVEHPRFFELSLFEIQLHHRVTAATRKIQPVSVDSDVRVEVDGKLRAAAPAPPHSRLLEVDREHALPSTRG